MKHSATNRAPTKVTLFKSAFNLSIFFLLKIGLLKDPLFTDPACRINQIRNSQRVGTASDGIVSGGHYVLPGVDHAGQGQHPYPWVTRRQNK